MPLNGAQVAQAAKAAEAATADDCATGQHVLYSFLLNVNKLSADVDEVTRRLNHVEGAVESIETGQKDIAAGMTSVCDEMKEVKAIVKPIYAVWEKVKSGALLVLAAYFLKDAPELLKPVLALLAK